ncbi:MAG: octanoyltransferase [Myxococcota bacterium]
MSAWRLLRHGPGPGSWNMGVDEALLAGAARGQPSLRVYRWDGPWLSLGYAQPLDRERRVACEAAGVAIVRRVTGGRAVLHGGDLTYAVAAPLRWAPGDVGRSYALIAGGLLAAMRRLGLEAACVAPTPGARRAPDFDCFASAGGHEIVCDGLKLCGSAQRRTAAALLQHGSLRLQPDPPEARRAAGLEPEGATSLLELGAPCDVERVAEAVVAGLGDALGAQLVEAELDGDECSAAGKRGEEPSDLRCERSQEAL